MHCNQNLVFLNVSWIFKTFKLGFSQKEEISNNSVDLDNDKKTPRFPFSESILIHSVLGRDMTLNISNKNKISIFYC